MPSTTSLSAAHGARRIDAGRLVVWGGYALLLLVAPLVFRSSLEQSVLTQIGVAIVACLSYNMLLGQGGMLSFGHSVYTGLGSFVAVHAMLGIADGAFAVPMGLVPLIGGVAGMFFAVFLGYVTTKKAGTTFAMITLGLGELVAAMVLMVPEFFGGEGGISANRTAGKAFLGITYGPQVQVYYLIAIYAFACTVAMFAFTRTPLGRMLNAVRDNPERVEFIGYSTQRVRYFSFVIAGFFAGVAGGMYALNFEIATAEVVGTARSGAYLLFMVMYAPGGIASLIMMNLRVAAHRKLHRLWGWYALLAATALLMLAGAAALIEMVYGLQFGSAGDTAVRYLGLTLDTARASSWIGALALTVAGSAAFEVVRRRFARSWGRIQSEIEATMTFKEPT